jgi:hypothetical protein
VRGEHLHRVLAAGQRAVEPLLVLRRRTEEAEEGEQRGLAVEGRESGGDVEETAQRLAAAGGQGVRRGGELDFEAAHGEHPVQHVHQRIGQRAPQIAYLGGEPGEADACLRGEGETVLVAAARARAAVQEGLQCVGERDDL